MRFAYPLLKQYELPFALYIPTSFPDRLGELWWLALETVIAQNSRVGVLINGESQFFDCRTVGEKQNLYDQVYGYMRSMNSEDELRHFVRDLAARHKVDMAAFCRDLCMDWPEIVTLAADPLVTIGAHTVNHNMLKKMDDDAAVRAEMDMSRAVLQTALGKRPQHLAYPVGDPTSAGPREFRIAAELGFKTAVTTRPGVLFKAHRDHLTALPRLSQRRFPAPALSRGADVGRRHGGVERLPPRQRGLVSGRGASGRSIQLTSGIAGRTQPSPATT